MERWWSCLLAQNDEVCDRVGLLFVERFDELVGGWEIWFVRWQRESA